MKRWVFIVIIAMIFPIPLSSSLASIERITYQDIFTDISSISWKVESYEDENNKIDGLFSTGSTLQLLITGDPNDINFLSNNISEQLNQHFELIYNDEPFDAEFLPILLIANLMIMDDGTTQNLFDFIIDNDINDQFIVASNRTIEDGKFIESFDSYRIPDGVFTSDVKIYNYNTGVLERWESEGTHVSYVLVLDEPNLLSTNISSNTSTKEKTIAFQWSLSIITLSVILLARVLKKTKKQII